MVEITVCLFTCICLFKLVSWLVASFGVDMGFITCALYARNFNHLTGLQEFLNTK